MKDESLYNWFVQARKQIEEFKKLAAKFRKLEAQFDTIEELAKEPITDSNLRRAG